MTKLLLDGDMLVYQSCVAVEKDVEWDDRFHILYSDSHQAWNVLQDKLHNLSEIALTEDYYFTFSDPDHNFRKDLIGDDYKSNREGLRKPLAYWKVREWCEKEYSSKMIPTLEADDVMGIMMTGEGGNGYILWSGDKDLKQIPGRHVDGDVVTKITQEQGERFFFYQVLAGDKVDGYEGCKGVGPVKANKLLVGQNTDTYWDTVVQAYEKAGQSEADAIYNAQMAKILQINDYVNNKVIFWNPK